MTNPINLNDSDNALASFIELSANILGSSMVQNFVNIGFSIYTAFHFANNKWLTRSFVFVAIGYLILLLLFTCINKRKTRRKEEAESLAEVSTQLQKLVYNRMQTLDRECDKYVKKRLEFDTNIESEADFICDALYTVLSRKLKYQDLEVVLWHLMPDSSGEGAIAYPVSFGTKGDNPPVWIEHSKERCFLRTERL